jgi:hypothetical protein
MGDGFRMVEAGDLSDRFSRPSTNRKSERCISVPVESSPPPAPDKMLPREREKKASPTDILYQSGKGGLETEKTVPPEERSAPAWAPVPEGAGMTMRKGEPQQRFLGAFQSLLKPGRTIQGQALVMAEDTMERMGLDHQTTVGITTTTTRLMKTSQRLGLGTGMGSLKDLWSANVEGAVEMAGSTALAEEAAAGAEILDKFKGGLSTVGKLSGMGVGALGVVTAGMGVFNAGREMIAANSAYERLAALGKGSSAAVQGMGSGVTAMIGKVPSLADAPVSIASKTVMIGGKAVTWSGVVTAAGGAVIMGEGISDMIEAYREKGDSGFIRTEKGALGAVKTSAGALMVAGGCTCNPVLVAAGGVLYVGAKGWENRDEIIEIATTAKDMATEGIRAAGNYASNEAGRIAGDLGRRAETVKAEAQRIISAQKERAAAAAEKKIEQAGSLWDLIMHKRDRIVYDASH